MSPRSAVGGWEGTCSLASQGCSELPLTLKSVKHPATAAVSATEKPRRKLILVPEACLNKPHHMLGSEQRQSFASRQWSSTNLLSPGYLSFPEQLSLVSLLLSLLCAHKRWGLCALTQGMPWPRKQGEGRLGCSWRWPACDVVRTTAPSLGVGLWSPWTSARGSAESR